MKRWSCIALALLLCGTSALGSLSPALAESGESTVVNESVDMEAVPAEDAGDTGLVIEGMENTEPAQAAEEVPTEAAAPVEIAEPADAGVLAPDEGAEVLAAATGIQLSSSAITIGVKEVFTGLTVSAVPAGSPLPAVTWRTSNKKYVKVDAATGKITGVKKGSATVYAQMENGQEVACNVTVMKAPKKVSVSPSTMALSEGGMSGQLSVSLTKKTASGTLTYTSSNPAVATVDATGRVTSVSPGTATITVKAFNRKKGTCKVSVMAAPAALRFSSDNISIATGQKLSLNPTALAADGSVTEAAVTYAIASGNSGIISLDNITGEVTGLSKGAVVVSAVTHNGISSQATVTVSAAPAAIALNASSITVGVKEVYANLGAELTPPAGETSCATKITWTTSNKKVAKVDSTGKITGVKKGTCTITANTHNGKTAQCKVTVKKAPSKLTISPTKGSLSMGQSNQFKITLPKGTGGTVTFASSNPAVATIDANTGVVTAIAAGEATITATAFNGKKATARLEVKGVNVSLPESNENVDSNTTQYSPNMTNAEKLEYVIYRAQTQLGKPYIYGSGYTKDDNPPGFDCSGLVYWSFLRIGIKLKDSAYKQGYDSSLPKISITELKRGDVVCFDTISDDDLSDHTGIYLGGGKFIHASSSGSTVIISTLASGYYNRTFSWGRRVLN